MLAGVSFVGLGVQGRLRHADTIVFCVVLCLPLALRTINLKLSLALVALTAFVQWLTSTPQISDAAVIVPLFWIALDGEPPEVAAAAAVIEIGAVLAALRWSPDNPAKVWVGITGLAAAAGALGLAVRERRALVVTAAERAARLEFERDQEGRLGAAAERARGGRSRPDQPQPGLDRLDDLLARVEAAGVPVSIEIDGDAQQLPSGVQLTIFRVTQEALGGRGLRGMQERAVAYGGQLEAGPLEQGGWRVRLTRGADAGTTVS